MPRNPPNAQLFYHAAAFVTLFTSCSADSALNSNAGNRDYITLEDFTQSLPTVVDQNETKHVVEGDILLHSLDEVEDYYNQIVTVPDHERFRAVIETDNGGDERYTNGTEDNLTYCVSNSFTPIAKSAMISSLSTAASRWEAISDVDFRYVPLFDSTCDSNPSGVWFSVVPIALASGAFAFYPNDPRSQRRLLVASGTVGESNTMTHEIGHILGFRHEHGRPATETGLTGCVDSFPPGRAMTPYDSLSVMHYPSGDDCGGENDDYFISTLDTLAIQSLYGSAIGECSLASDDICSALGATCEELQEINGSRFDTCRWASANTPTTCSNTVGIWTAAGSSFAQAFPGAVPPGQSGACLTQVTNRMCRSSDADLCLLNGATCERAYNVNGTRRDLCRWHNIGSRSQCNQTSGLWTTSGSGFANTWPTAVPAGRSGACITQVRNLR